ncbi:GIP [Symbiodinium natans]|uniref:GIP protein n=1 Tax=Symbiodinium natans TaxID=878477 RepID=A0A812MDZ3_9DINO|nr:GIP [Symbiodinium natans]
MASRPALQALLSVQESLRRAAESCEVVLQHEAFLGEALEELQAPASGSNVLSACHELAKSVRHAPEAPARQLMTYTPFLESTGWVWADFAIATAFFLVLAILWECLFLRSTLSCCRKAVGDFSGIRKQIQELGGRLAIATGWGHESPTTSEREVEKDDAQVPEDKDKHKEDPASFWAGLAEEALKQPPDAQTDLPAASCEVGFDHLNFAGKASEGQAEVTLYRRGAASESVAVRVVPSKSPLESTDCVACNGKDYVLEETIIKFKPNETSARLPITLRQPGKHRATQYFEIELAEVVEGSAALGGPTLGLDTERRKVRVYIFNDYAFPCDIPEHRRKSKLWITWYYLQERRLSRGIRWWKTLLGLLYQPIHSVCVTALVQKLALDRVSDPDYPGDKLLELAILGLVSFLSLALLRWGDKVATENRGRTGGTRMVHRRQLFAKLLMLDAEELTGVEGHWWFYVGVNNTDIMAKDAYYQGFVVLQSVFGLLLSIAMLCYAQFSKLAEEDVSEEFLNLIVPSVAMVVTALLCAFAVLRLPRLGKLLVERMRGEAAWVDTLSWLCHAGLPMQSLATRTHAKLDMRFTAESKFFTTFHVKARDFSNDTVWFTKWITNLVRILILVLGTAALLKSRREGSDAFQSGDFVFQLKVFSSCGKYLEKVISSLIKMFSASVGLEQFVSLVNLPEKSTLKSSGSHVFRAHGSNEIRFEKGDDYADGCDGKEQTELARHKSRIVHRSFTIPLGGAVRVSSTQEKELVNFFTQVSELKMLHFGRMYRPAGIRVGYVPAVALRTPHTKVMEELQDGCPAGIPIGERLVHLLEINPQKRMKDLRPGEAQLLAILLALFRDPDVLVLNRPCALLTESQHQKVWTLLELWQTGGAAKLLENFGLAPQQPAKPGLPRRKRTLITSRQDVALNPNSHCSVYDLDLDTGRGEFVSRDQSRPIGL